jgi:hypothetical protein
MKGSLSVSVFINRIEHILTHQNIINGKLYPDYFADHKKCSFSQYRNRAICLGLDFSISEFEYNDITKNNCYICGKLNSSKNENGIDRVDNSIGYILENARACCAECNYMKIDYNFDDMIRKFTQIHNIHNTTTFENNIIRTCRFK